MTSFLKWPAATIAPALIASAIAVAPATATPALHSVAIDVVPTASTTVMLDGTYAFGLEGKMHDKLQGYLCGASYDCVEAEYDNWLFAPLSDGVEALDAMSTAVDGHLVVLGYSRGAAAAQKWIDANAGSPSVRSPEDTDFVFVGNPYRKYGGSQADEGLKLSTGGYNVIDISNQYDSVSDVPVKGKGSWFARMLARQNASLSQHLSYDDVDLSRPDLLVYVEQNPGGGTTTYVLVPTENLPMLDGLRRWAPKTAAKFQEKWKPLIDSTYDRSKFTPAGPGGVQLPFDDAELPTKDGAQDVSFVFSPEKRQRLSGSASEANSDVADDSRGAKPDPEEFRSDAPAGEETESSDRFDTSPVKEGESETEPSHEPESDQESTRLNDPDPESESEQKPKAAEAESSTSEPSDDSQSSSRRTARAVMSGATANDSTSDSSSDK